MYCTKCGATVQEGAAFCRHCGQPIGSAVTGGVEGAAEGVTEGTTVGAGVSFGDRYEATIPPSAPPPFVAYGAPIATGIGAPPIAYAGFWLRAVAYLIDSAIVGIVFGAIAAILAATVGLHFFRGRTPGIYAQAFFAQHQAFEYGAAQYRAVQYQTAPPWMPAAALGIIFILIPIIIAATWLYFAMMESSARQATIGKIALGLYVTDLQGRRLSFGRATGRFFAKIITGLVPLFIGYIMAGFTARKQALHDMIAGCLVLKKI
jgi:uncharacterized RDD family membrane protein YckC